MSEAAGCDKVSVDDLLEEAHANYVKKHPNAFDDIVDDNISTDENILITQNPLQVSLDALHLERIRRTRIKKGEKHYNKDGSINYRMNYKLETEIIPALDVRWLTLQNLYCDGSYQRYFPQFSREENLSFESKNADFIQTLEELLKLDFQKFWCVLLFSKEMRAALHKFVFEFVYACDYDCMNREEKRVYASVLVRVLHVYQRMFRFKESEVEYFSEEVGVNYLITNQHLTTPIIMRLAILFLDIDENLVKKIVEMYYAPIYKSTYTKELRESLLNVKTILETVEYVVTETKPPPSSALKAGYTEIRTKPVQFDPHWAQEMVAHLLDCFYALSSFLPLLEEAIEIVIELGLPILIPLVFDKVFKELEAYMKDRASVTDRLRYNIENYTKVARNEAVKSYYAIVTYCIKRIMETANDSKNQETLVEMYLELIQDALGYHSFIVHYDEHCSISLQLDQICSFHPKIEQLRVNYIKGSVDAILLNEAEEERTVLVEEKLKNCKISDLWNHVWGDVLVDDPPLDINTEELQQLDEEPGSEDEETEDVDNKPKEDTNEEVEQMIRSIMETLPHLGDGFILQCLEHYQYNLTDTLAAILDESLPPHLAEIPFDTPRIPEETEPEEQPFVAHQGKREDYQDAMQLLDDKNAIKDIKKLIVIGSTNAEASDEDFDDRTYDYEPVLPGNDDDDGEERVLRHMIPVNKNLTVASDFTDDSEEEEEEEASAKKPPGAFCEDPAVIRARREAQQRRKSGRGRSFDVVGKPKGQGQEKDVQHNRDKKNTNKSSRANHNRKKGAQWKKSRGMM